MTSEAAKNIAEVIALACAALFFCNKFLRGYFVTNLSLSLKTSRREINGIDVLIVALKLTKGERGSVDLHDAKVRVTWHGGEAVSTFAGVERLSYSTEMIGMRRRRVADFGTWSEKSPMIRLTPDEETTFSTHVDVPIDVICTVEAVVLGSRPRWHRFEWLFKERIGQWRASVVLPPAKNT